MTEPSTITTPTLEQRAAAITQLCPPGWIVKPYGSTLAVTDPDDAHREHPYCISGEDAAIVATIWDLYVRSLKPAPPAEPAPILQVAEAIEWCTVNAGRALAAELAGAMRKETGADVEPKPHSRSNVLDEVRGLGEATERFDRAAKHGLLPDGSIDAEFKVEVPAAVIADMFPFAERIVCIDPHTMVDGEHERVLFDNGPGTYARDQASVVCEVLPNGDIEVLKNRRGQAGRWSFQPGVTFAEMVWTGSAWVPLRRPMGFAGDAPAAAFATPAITHTEPSGMAETMVPVTITGIDGPVPVRAAGWTGITWMSGKGRAKSLTLPGLRQISVTGVGDKACLRVAPEVLTDAKAKRVFNKAWKLGRLLTFHLPGGVLKRATVSAIATSDSLAHGAVAGDIFVALPQAEPPKPARQGIAWRSPGGADCFADLPIRPTSDNAGNHVIEVHAELPEGLHTEVIQVVRDRPIITVTTAHGTKFKGPVLASACTRGREGVVWRLTMPLPSPTPRT